MRRVDDNSEWFGLITTENAERRDFLQNCIPDVLVQLLLGWDLQLEPNGIGKT